MNYVTWVYRTSDRLAGVFGRPVAVAWRKVTGSDPRILAILLLLFGAAVAMRTNVVARTPAGAAIGVAAQLAWLALVSRWVQAHDQDNAGGERTVSGGAMALRAVTLLLIPMAALDVVKVAAHGQLSAWIVGAYDGSTLLGLLIILAGDPGGRSVWQDLAERRARRLVMA